MIFKRFLAICLALTLLFSLAACGGSEKKVWDTFSPEATTEKTVLTAQDGSTITISPVSYDNDYADVRLNFYNAASEPRFLGLSAFSVNGVMIDFDMGCYTEPGETVSEQIGASLDLLRQHGIFEIATMEFLFAIFSEDLLPVETLSCQLKSSAGKNFKSDANAAYKALTSKEAQQELGYTVLHSEQVHLDLGYGVYITSRVYMRQDGVEYLMLEVANESDALRYTKIYTGIVNGMNSNIAGDGATLFPGQKAVLTIDTEWALHAHLREAFGVPDIASISMYSEVYPCTPDGEMDWDDPGEYAAFSYEVPGRTATPDYTGQLIYDGEDIKIYAKSPVSYQAAEDIVENYVYLLFRNVSENDYTIEQTPYADIAIDGTCSYAYFSTPYYLGMDDLGIGYLELDNLEGGYATLPLTLTNNDTGYTTELQLNLSFR